MIAVTGSHGFIGRHVLRELDHANIGALELDRKHPETPIDCMTITPALLAGCDAVIHLAAHADVRNNWQNLATIEQDNLLLTLRVLEAARLAETVRTFVFISTGSVYSGLSGLVRESDVLRQESPYAASKIAGEAYTQAYAAKCGWRWIVLRPAACIGAGYHHGHIADFVAKAKAHGAIEPLDNGTTPRAVVHVADMASACVRVLDAPSGIYNVASETMWTWRPTVDVMSETRRVNVLNVPKNRINGWVGDGRGARFDTSRLRALGWRAERTIYEGVKDALESLGW